MLVLAVDSSTDVGSVSLLNEEKLIGEHLLNLEQTHSQRLMPQIIELVTSSGYQLEELEGIGVAIGPGSFTGTRIGLATAKTLAQSLQLPIVGVSTLEAIAYSCKYVTDYICPVIDARGGRVFTTLYQGGDQLEAKRKETLLSVEDVVDQLATIEEPIYFVGQIAQKYQEQIEAGITVAQFVTNSFNLPRGGAVGELAFRALKAGNESDLFALTPNYLKRSQAEVQWEQQHG
ncbi:tRNA (adenosine(37)-N6)-threonylcarbamoyltransferase complex dimerization subunit type 1 TsaB [Halanaerobaculum tunisiense]